MALNVELYTPAELTKEIHRPDGPVVLHEPINLFSDSNEDTVSKTEPIAKVEEATSVGLIQEPSTFEPAAFSSDSSFEPELMPMLEPSIVIEMPSAEDFQGIQEPKGTEFKKHEVPVVEKKIQIAQKIEDLIPASILAPEPEPVKVPAAVEKTTFFKQDNDLEILKNYLMLREQDLAILKSQNNSLKEELERAFEKNK